MVAGLKPDHQCDGPWSCMTCLRAKVQRLRAKVERLEGDFHEATMECTTCSGSGVMEVLARVEPPNEREIYQPAECGECHGEGVGAGFIAQQAHRLATLERVREAAENCVLNFLAGEPHEREARKCLRQALRAAEEKNK